MQRLDNMMHFDYEVLKRKIQQRKSEAVLSDRLISRATLANKLEVSRSTLYRWENSGILPKPDLRKGNTVRWSENAIDLWWSTTKDTL